MSPQLWMTSCGNVEQTSLRGGHGAVMEVVMQSLVHPELVGLAADAARRGQRVSRQQPRVSTCCRRPRRWKARRCLPTARSSA
jgi:hypothetical protein